MFIELATSIHFTHLAYIQGLSRYAPNVLTTWCKGLAVAIEEITAFRFLFFNIGLGPTVVSCVVYSAGYSPPS